MVKRTLALLVASLVAGALYADHRERRAPPSATGALAYEVRDGDTHALIPCKLTLVGVDGTPPPAFTRNDIGRQEGDAVVAYDRVMSLRGVGVVPVPVGTYDVYVSRGPEWDLHVERGVRISPAGAELRASLRHVVDTAGWISGDFHVHAAASPDSHVPMQDRIYEFVSDGVEYIVSTDHNVVSDYGPIIDELGARALINSATGDELTTNGWGHFGAFPLPRELGRAGGGAVLVHGRAAVDFFADVRRSAPGAILDVHHPRIDGEVGYFNVSAFDARADVAARKGFSFDFDALEVLNGYQDAERRSVDRVIDDWFSLLNHGHLVTATGNSDTHHLDYNIGGYPRNYVRVGGDDPGRVAPEELATAIRAHRAFFTTGPFVRVSSGRAEIGDLVAARGGAPLQIEVQAAPWISVSRVTLYVNGNEAKRWAVAPSEEVVRFRQRYDVTATHDTYVVVRVDGDRPLAPVVGDTRRFDVRPLALTNPIFLDVDGNGVFDRTYPHGRHR